MKIKTEEFAAKFHSLNGLTVGERRKNLFLLLNQTSQGDISELDFSTLQPRTPLEEKFKAETMLYFKRLPDLIELLKSENPIFIAKVLKSSILKDFCQNVTSDELVFLLFPYVSFSTKEKILNKLCLLLNNSQRADKFYQAVENKYGSYLAFKLLPSCSLDLIMNQVRSSRVMLTPRQVEVVINKHPSATEELLTIIEKNFRSENYDYSVEDLYKKVFIGVCKRDINLFAKLHQKCNFSFHLGWRLTDRLVRVNKNKIIQKPNVYCKFLNTKQIAKTLHQTFKDYYINLFPKTIEMFKDSQQQIFSTLKHLPSKMKNLSLYLSCFETVYGEQLWNYPQFVTKEVLDMLSAEEREQRIKIEYKPVDMPEEVWITYMKTEKSIPLLKKKLHLTSDNRKKMQLVQLLVKTCKVNEDREGLLNICKFMLARYDKEQLFILQNFLTNLRATFKLENVDEQHWLCINELVQNCKAIGNGRGYSCFYDDRKFDQSYIHYRLLNNLSVKEQLTNWFENYKSFSIMKGNPQYEKKCLLKFCEIVPQILKGKDKESHWKLELFSAVLDWNKRYGDDQISLITFADIFDSIKEKLNEDCDHEMANIARYFISMERDTNRKASFLDLYLSSNRYIDLEIINLLLFREPQTIQQYIDNIIQNVLGKSYGYKKYKHMNDVFWKTSKNYSHLKIPQQIANTCLKEFNNQAKHHGDSDVVKNAITALSHLMPATEFLKLIIPYYPSDLQADSKTEEGRKMYQLQETICTCLKNVTPASEALQTILIFCKGDYLKLVRQPLYSASSKTNEDKLPPFFSAIADRAVSVRKHAIHLAFRVLDKKCIGSVLNQFMESDKNVSMHKFIFKCAFNFFKKSPDDYTWDLAMLSMKAVDLDDEEAFEILMDVSKIPQEYIAKYVPFTWDILSKLPEKESEKTKLLLISSSVVQLLPKEFCEMIINNYLLKSGDDLTHFQATVQSFTCKYIIYCNSQTEQEERLKMNFGKLRDYIAATWNNPSSKKIGRNCASCFVQEFCKEFLSNGCSDKEILMKFADLWNSLLKPHEALDDYLHLQLTLIHIENLILPEIARKVSALCDALVGMYGPVVVGLLPAKISYFTEFWLGDQSCYDLIKSIVIESSTVSCLLLAISLLNNETSTSTSQQVKAKHDAIVKLLESKPDPVIQLHLQSHFSGTTSI